LGFEESALARLRRYREEADASLELIREAEDMARRFSGRLFAGFENTAVLGRQAGFEIQTAYAGRDSTSARIGPAALACQHVSFRVRKIWLSS
jgi:hypothetical protein